MANSKTYNLLIASFLEADLVEHLAAIDQRINVVYRPDLLRKPRYAADHKGLKEPRTPAQESEWLQLLRSADILFDFDQTHIDDLPEVAPNVIWLQATSSGIGQFIHQHQYDIRMPKTVFTTARGVHAQPLAEFCLMAITMFRKGIPGMIRDQKAKKWERYAGTDLMGRTIVIVGLGSVGRRVAQLARAYGIHVIGVKRNVKGIEPSDVDADELYSSNDLHSVLPKAEHLIIVTPHTPDTENMIGQREVDLLPGNCIFISIGRGATIDETALLHALQTKKIEAAALDVFRDEPLPVDSPFWSMPNVLVSPHSASTSDRENDRITELFITNIRRFLDGKPLLNVLDTEKRF